MLALIGGANPRRAHPALSCSAAMLSVSRVGLHYLLPPQHKQIRAGKQQRRGGGGGEEGALTGKRWSSVGGREEGKRLQTKRREARRREADLKVASAAAVAIAAQVGALP